MILTSSLRELLRTQYLTRFWTNQAGEKIFNPFLFCCNLLSVEGKGESKVGLGVEVSVREDGDYRLLSRLFSNVSLLPGAPLKSVAASSVGLDHKLLQTAGDVVFQVR